MGNCQAVDAAALVIQHPSGKIDRLYWPLTAGEVMKTNPGHYVSLIIPLPVDTAGDESSAEKTVKYTRVKLLRPSDTLVLGRAYRLVTSQEVMKVLRAKRYGKMKNSQQGSSERLHRNEERRSEFEKNSQGTRQERRRYRSGSTNIATTMMRPKSWRPSLQSISEAGNQ